MTKISLYPPISSPKGDDILIGTDIHHSDATKNFMIQDMFAIGLETSVTKLKIYDPTLFGYGEMSIDNDVLTILGAPTNTRKLLQSSATGFMSFKKNNYDVKLDATSATGNRTYVLPNTSGTVALVETTTLQQVTDAGNTTDNTITVNDGSSIQTEISTGGVTVTRNDSGDIYATTLQNEGVSISSSFDSVASELTRSSIKFTSSSNYIASLGSGSSLTANRNYTFPNASGTLALQSAASGSFLSQDGKTITVTNGIITSIV